MSRLTWPDYVPDTSSSSGPGGRASRRSLDRTGERLSERTLATAAAGSIAPIVYGIDQVGPKWVIAGRRGRDLVALAYWCLGPITAIDAITTRDGEPLPDGVQTVHLLGEPDQTAPQWLLDIGYANDLVGLYRGQPVALAATVFLLPPGTEAALRCIATIRGRKVYDPRAGTTAWSRNPALATADYAQSTVYGPGWVLDDASVVETADACDELLSDGQRRRTINLKLPERGSHGDRLEALRTYAGCFIVRDGDTRRLVPDRPVPLSTSGPLTLSDGTDLTLSDGSTYQLAAAQRHIDGDQLLELTLRRRKARNAPTVYRVWYTDRTKTPWVDDVAEVPRPGVKDGSIPRRVSAVQLPGFETYAQAYREATERLNLATVADLEGEARTTDEGLRDLAGDVVFITDALGVTQKPMRIVSAPPDSPGTWRLSLVEYDASAYSDSVVTGPSRADTDLPRPSDVPNLTGLTATEEVYQLQDGTYASRLRITADETDYPYRHRYQVQVTDGAGDEVWAAELSSPEGATPPIQEGVTYTVRARIVSELGFNSAEWSDATITAEGKYLAPGDVPQVTVRRVAADTVRVEWLEAVDLDIWRYDLRYGPVGVSWDTARHVDLVDALTHTIDGLMPGSYDVLVKAVDSVKQRSPHPARATASIAPPDAPASLSAFEVGGEVRLSWAKASGYVDAYEVRYGALGIIWADAELLDEVRALRYVTKDIPAGDWDILVRSVDGAGNLSSAEVRTSVTVTLDAGAFLVDEYAYKNPGLTAMHAYWLPTKPARTRYVTDSGESWNSLFPNLMNNYTDPLFSYHGAVASEWLSEAHDLGTVVSGQWTLEGGWEAVSGSVTAAMEISEDGSTWQAYGTSAKAKGRYVRARISGSGADTILVIAPDVRVRVDATPREEVGEIQSAASGPATVTLDREYTAVQEIMLSPQGTQALSAVHDSISVGDPTTFDVYVFDDTGSQVSVPVRWKWKGV